MLREVLGKPSNLPSMHTWVHSLAVCNSIAVQTVQLWSALTVVENSKTIARAIHLVKTAILAADASKTGSGSSCKCKHSRQRIAVQQSCV
jgi:hypothetical protein